MMDKYADFIRSTGYGDPAGLSGPNCRHSFSAFIPGISAEPSQKELEQQDIKDAETTRYTWIDARGVKHDRLFTLREALDRQRSFERAMRSTRAEIKAQEAAGQGEEVAVLRARYKSQSSEYRRFSAAIGIKEQRNRIYMDGLGKV